MSLLIQINIRTIKTGMAQSEQSSIVVLGLDSAAINGQCELQKTVICPEGFVTYPWFSAALF